MPAECTVNVPLKRTPWFDATQHNPGREGSYEVRFRLNGSGNFCEPRRERWSSGEWQFGCTGKPFGTVDGDQWRGLMPASGVAADAWIDWTSGDGSPAFEASDMVSVRTRGGRETGFELRPWEFSGWNHTGSPNDIVQYRINRSNAGVRGTADGCAVHGLAHPCEACAAELPYRDLLEHWTHESHLQTFEDRERFRKAAKELLGASGVLGTPKDQQENGNG